MSAITRNIWKPTRNVEYHTTVKQHAMREKVTSYGDETPDFASMKPGDSVSFSLNVRPDKVQHSEDDKLVFSNGGTIEDKPDEAGLMITSPDGETSEVSGWVNGYTSEPEINFRFPNHDYDEGWTQKLLKDGGCELTFDSDWQRRSVILSPNGEMKVNEEFCQDEGYEVSRKGDAVVFQTGGHANAFVPPVPLSWLVAK